MRDHFASVVAVCVTVFFIACIGMGYQHCQNQYERRETCTSDGHRSALECQQLYPTPEQGDRR